MSGEEVTGSGKRFVIRLVGLQPGKSTDDLVPALQQLYRGKTEDEIRMILAQFPVMLSRSATEEQAKKIKPFLEAKGAVLKITYASAAPPKSVEKAKEEPKVEVAAPMIEPVPPKEKKTLSGAERRVKPRVHPGIQLHPMGVGEILDRSFRILRQYFWLFFIIALIPQAAFLLLSVGVGVVMGESTPTMGMGFGISSIVAGILFAVLQFWAQGALIFAVSETYLGHSTSIMASYGAMRRRLLRLLGTSILWWILVFLVPALTGIVMAVMVPFLLSKEAGGLVVGLLVGIVVILAVWMSVHLFMNWLLVDKVVVLEDKGGMRALRRSTELMKARTEPGFWKRPKMKAGVILTMSFLFGIGIYILFQIPGLSLTYILPGSLVTATIQAILSMAAMSLATVYVAITMILYYYDIRVRREGFDFKMMAENI
jgi:hypothetical protein